jgi:hypothetical protein
LRIIFWDLYIIVNEQQTTLAQVWDGTNLKLTFRRTISHALLDRWLELLALMQTISMSDSDDSPIWFQHKKYEGCEFDGGFEDVPENDEKSMRRLLISP